MTSQTPDTHAVLERLEKLERQNRALRRVWFFTFAAVAALVLMGLAIPKSRTIEAQKFVVKDARDKTRVEIGLAQDAPRIVLYDQEGRLQARLEGGTDGAEIRLHDASGDAYSGLWAGSAGAMVYAHDQDGNELFLGSLKTGDVRSGKLRITGKPTIVMMDKNEKDIWRALERGGWSVRVRRRSGSRGASPTPDVRIPSEPLNALCH